VTGLVPVLQQLQVFLQTILIGIVVGMVIDLYRTVRRQGRPGPWITVAGDLFLWIFLAILVFFLLLPVNWGQVRAFIFLGMILGLSVYFHFFSSLFLRFSFQFFNCCRISAKFLLSVVLFPFRLVQRIMVFPLGLISLALDFLWRLSQGTVRRLFFCLRKGISRLAFCFRRKRP
jgi:spore cortex biosynthesis protein YabQ